MIEDRARDIVYLPVAAELLRRAHGWSAPVQIRFQKPFLGAEPELVVHMIGDEPPKPHSSWCLCSPELCACGNRRRPS